VTKEKTYDDIRDMEYPFKTSRMKMKMQDRAAQFSPFAALTGYDALIDETARITESRIELDETEKAEMDRTIGILLNNLSIQASITYFLKDKKKSGGAYLTVTGHIIKIDNTQRTIIMEDKRVIPIKEIISIRQNIGR